MNKEQLISKGKELILDDMAKKVIPMNVQSFEDLHKYVDANGYISNNFECFDISQIEMFNEVSKELCEWLKSRLTPDTHPHSCDNETCRKEYSGEYNGGFCSEECRI